MSDCCEPRPTRAVILSLLLTLPGVFAAITVDPRPGSGALAPSYSSSSSSSSSTTFVTYVARQARPRWLPHRESSQSQLQGATGGPAFPLPRTHIVTKATTASTSAPSDQSSASTEEDPGPETISFPPSLSAHIESSVSPSAASPSQQQRSGISYVPGIKTTQSSLDLPSVTGGPLQNPTPIPYQPEPSPSTIIASSVRTETPGTSLYGPTGPNTTPSPGNPYEPDTSGTSDSPGTPGTPAGSGGGEQASPPNYVTEPLTLTSGTAIITTWTVVTGPPSGGATASVSLELATARGESTLSSVAIPTGPIVVLPPSSAGPAPVYGGGSATSVGPATVSGAGDSSDGSGGRIGSGPGADGQTDSGPSSADSTSGASSTSGATSSDVAAAAPGAEPTLQDAAAARVGQSAASLLLLPLVAMGLVV